MVGRRAVGEAWEGSCCFLHAAGHGQGVVAQGGRHWHVSELWVEVSEVCGTTLWNPREEHAFYHFYIVSYVSCVDAIVKIVILL